MRPTELALTVSLTMTLGAAIAACSSNSTSTGTDAGGAGEEDSAATGIDAGGGGEDAASPDASAADAGAGPFVSGQVVDGSSLTAAKAFDATQYSPLAGVQVCLYGQSSVPCATTDANGKYNLAVPVGTALTVSYVKTGYQPTLYAIGAQTAGSTDDAPAIFLTSTSSFASLGTMGGAPPDPTKGTILFGGGTIGPSPGAINHELFGTFDYYYVPGYSVTIAPAATVGPVYTSADWQPDPSLTASSNAGWGFFQAAPGNYTLTYSSPTLNCGTTTTTVVACYATTYVGVACTVLGDGGTPVVDASADASADGG
jgi:hypothetical protein